ncbi:uncharacterized protein MONOS_10861 [Monocercomonoides exilis]|uniref:uncharacterized protein n=1 Tax=Monocercomonoides exilis TaxID=2049356 RepID=UPI00355A2B29|nr:hypothetical protein MONOS_10861 [Monocercomonoides exilis]|eukprot:MONOS_10861.1-p1 / transcript=MONOS_10861.1 / gene=MONOS_10861 / organism=Monocercomonoides_exilis_PA203 / gene_product=unspecified product / transcript_product=unspecified product / location=Mono_scaffold00512:30986-32114(+) / protein_length=349 / sequence_SO=supercontig / SO=protein_coding / is_pseudo=false
MATKEEQNKLGRPIGRYGNFKKPKDFDESLAGIQRDRIYSEDQNFHIFPTDVKSSNSTEIAEEMQIFSMQIQAHRKALSMKTGDPVFILRSSLHLRELYKIATDFATNPVDFMELPLDECPSLEQQLFEDQLMVVTTHLHPFLTFIYSAADMEFILYFNIPIPHDLGKSGKSKGDSEKESLPPTLQYLQPAMEQVKQLSRFYPTASRPVVVTNSFPERMSSQSEALLPFGCSCSNVRCDKNQLNSTETTFSRCTACKLVLYCSKECQRIDWPRHQRFCMMHRMVSEGSMPPPLPIPPPLPKSEASTSSSSLTASSNPSSQASASSKDGITFVSQKTNDVSKGPVIKLQL